ncbi:hypothetical protein FCM35_KLT20533 [Carex littledalei]|uniref:Zinc finger PHD-type domain-containing protein n=1 Tax=Carex littledalei TaxID=544730 RepID=A0A833VEN3_9POAL|nr:hypothetical protein FCM35_KLT20533 [Carex littledalei]
MAAQGARTASGTTGCTGEGCRTRDAWPLHHVKHRSVFVRLCTACVLKYHPSMFCSLCHDLLLIDSKEISSCDRDSISSSPPSCTNNIIHCSNCPNVCHASCLPPSSSSASSDFFLCPPCSSSAAAATADALLSSRRRSLDLSAAQSLLCAARLSAHSMTRAAASARADADRKAKEAAAARKRAREMIERVATVAKKEKEKEKRGSEEQEQDHRERETERVKFKGAITMAGAGGGREREKWMRLYEMPSQVSHPGPLTVAKFEQDDTKDTVAPLKPTTVLPSSVSKE